MKAALVLPGSLQRRLEAAATDLLQPSGVKPHDFTQPPGEPALAAPDSVSWQVFKSPLALLIGGVTAVILEPAALAFLRIMADAPLLPGPLQSMQPLLVRAGVDVTPAPVRRRSGLDAGWSLPSRQRGLVARLARLADRLVPGSSAAVRSCRQLGLPDHYLCRRLARAFRSTP